MGSLAPGATSRVTSLLHRAALQRPESTAVVGPALHLTYAELERRALEVAALLGRAGLDAARPEPVGALVEHDPETPQIYLGIMAAGHAVVPLSNRLPAHSLAKIARAAQLRLVLVGPQAQERIGELAAHCPEVAWVRHDGAGAPARLASEAAVLPPGIAMVPYTSGTTGDPKGVLVTHLNLIVHAVTSAFVLGLDDGGSDVHVNPMPLAHFTGASRVVIALASAGAHVIMPGFDADAVLAAIAEHRGTHIAIVPTMAADLLAAGPTDFELSSLRTLVYGAAPMPMEVARELLVNFDCELINGYGLTESTAMATALDGAAHRLALSSGDDELLASVGRAVPGMEVRIVDPDGDEVPSGSNGQIALKGPKVTAGYFNSPAETSAKYLPSGWLLTGDEGSLSDRGDLTLKGRIDDTIISGGLNIQPAEVEKEVLELSGVSACVAFPVPSRRWGQELHLAVVQSGNGGVDAQELRASLALRLDRFKIPKSVLIVDSLPYTATGKLRRGEMARHFGSGEEEGRQ